MASPKVTATSAGGCRKLAADSHNHAPLDRIVFGWGAPAATFERLSQAFPNLTVQLATGDDFIRALPGAKAAVAWSMTPEEYAAANDLRWFQSIGAGVERVLLPGMRENGLVVTNTSGIHSSNISEHVLSLMLAFARQLPTQLEGQARREWRDSAEIRNAIFELAGSTLLVVGFGDIGRALARKANALDMQVIGVRRNPVGEVPAYADRIVGLDQIEDVVGEADHVAICLPQTPGTTGLFNSDLIGRMKPGAYLYNIGRGPIVDTGALVSALASGHLAGAGLDVTDPEPLPAGSPLWNDKRVIITSHTAGSTPHFWSRITEILVDNISRFQKGESLVNVVDYDTGY